MADTTIIIDDEDVLQTENEAEEKQLKDRLILLKNRCDEAKIKFTLDEDPEFGISAEIFIPSGKSFRRIFIMSLARTESLLAVEFEKFRFLPGYEAIWCPSDNSLEVAIQTTRMSAEGLIRKIKEIPFNASSEDDYKIELSEPESSSKPKIEISRISSDLSQLLPNRMVRLSLKMTNLRHSTSEQVTNELTSYSNSLFFQIDLIHGYSFMLSRERRASGIPLSKKRKKGISIEYPTIHFNDDAMSLYWYGKNAKGMPLLQYLALYQCIEFYFPRYSQIEARKRISSLIRRPTFRSNREDDLDAIIAAVQSARSSGFGSERNQLRSVINECISAEEIRDYLQSDSDRLEHFTGKNKSKFHKIPVGNKSADLRNDVADRIYDIRCKIVHTKNNESDDELKMILPFSEDADYLIQDVELAEFICRNVLSSSSSELY